MASKIRSKDTSRIRFGMYVNYNTQSLVGNFLPQHAVRVQKYANLAMVDRLCGDTYFYVCLQTWFNEARTNIGMSPTMEFLNENDSLAYYAILGELSSGLSLTVGFFQDVWFSLIISGLFQEARKDITCSTLMI